MEIEVRNKSKKKKNTSNESNIHLVMSALFKNKPDRFLFSLESETRKIGSESYIYVYIYIIIIIIIIIKIYLKTVLNQQNTVPYAQYIYIYIYI